MSNCPHNNRHCAPEDPCTSCSGSGRPLRDGERARVPMLLMDGVQRGIAQHGPAVSRTPRSEIPQDVRAQARRDHEEWKRQHQPSRGDSLDEYYAAVVAASARSNAATLERAQRQHDAMQAVRDHYRNASEAAYAASVAAFDRSPKES